MVVQVAKYAFHRNPLEPGSDKAVFRIAEYTDVEPILAALRQSGAVIEDMQHWQSRPLARATRWC